MKKIKCKECGCQEFITQPNKYDVYEVEEGELVLQTSEIIDEEPILYCRECSEELENAEKLISS